MRNRLRQWLRAWLLGTTAAPAPAALPDPAEQPPGMSISWAAQMEARRTNRPAPQPEQIFARPVPPRGVLPDGMALDSCGLPAMADMSAWALSGVFHEGLAFLGYAYLAELAQRTEYRHISSLWAEHATRKWIKVTGPDDATANAIAAELERLGTRDIYREAIEQDGLFGRSQIFLGFGDEENDRELAVPLRVASGKISPKRPLKTLKVVEPMWSYPGIYGTTNPLAQDFYKPRHWFVYGKTVDDTRFLTLVGHEVPDMLKPSYAFGGLSRTQMAKAYVDNWLHTRESISDLISAFSQMVLSTEMGDTLAGGGGSGLYARIDMFNRTRNNRGTMVINHGTETLENIAVPLSGLDKLQAQSQEQMAAAARIPLSIYLQITPQGLNASSENEIRSFYADVKAYCEKTVRPGLQTLFEVVQLSLFDAADPAYKFEFVPLWESTDKEVAETDKLEAETDGALIAAGVVSNEEVRERMVNDEGGRYHGLTGPAPEPEPDETGETTDA